MKHLATFMPSHPNNHQEQSMKTKKASVKDAVDQDWLLGLGAGGLTLFRVRNYLVQGPSMRVSIDELIFD